MADRYQKMLLGETPPPRMSDEHRRILHQERQSARASRTRLSEDARQHHRVLAQIREGTSRERRAHRQALAENRWLLTLADMILARKRTR